MKVRTVVILYMQLHLARAHTMLTHNYHNIMDTEFESHLNMMVMPKYSAGLLCQNSSAGLLCQNTALAYYAKIAALAYYAKIASLVYYAKIQRWFIMPK